MSATPRPRLALAAALVAAACAADGRAAPAPAAAAFADRWVGAVVMDRARFEVDLEVRLARDPEGGLAGTLRQVVQGVEGELEEIAVAGGEIAFVYRDATGASRFRGTLSAAGDRIEGEMLEGGTAYEFYLARRPEAPVPRPLVALSADDAELRERFNADAGKVRLVTLLSPTCGTCLHAARAMERYLLEAVAGDGLAVYVVWGPMLERDSREAAAAATVHVPDPRAAHFWIDPPAVLAQVFARRLALESGGAWDVFFLYPPGVRWPGDEPPAAADYFHALGDRLPAERRFDGEAIARRVRELMAAGGQAGG
jgi:hypothetical protein